MNIKECGQPRTNSAKQILAFNNSSGQAISGDAKEVSYGEQLVKAAEVGDSVKSWTAQQGRAGVDQLSEIAGSSGGQSS